MWRRVEATRPRSPSEATDRDVADTLWFTLLALAAYAPLANAVRAALDPGFSGLANGWLVLVGALVVAGLAARHHGLAGFRLLGSVYTAFMLVVAWLGYGRNGSLGWVFMPLYGLALGMLWAAWATRGADDTLRQHLGQWGIHRACNHRSGQCRPHAICVLGCSGRA